MSDFSKQLFTSRLKKALAGAKADGSLRWNQQDIIDTVVKFLDARAGTPFTAFGKDVPDSDKEKKKDNNNAALIESSPGSGKTRIMGFLAKKAANINGAVRHGDATKVLIFTPRLDLNRQTMHEFDEKLGIRDSDVAIFDGKQNVAEKKLAKDRPVLIATYQSIPAMLQQGVISLDPKSPLYRGLIIMDEAHELVDFSYQTKPRKDSLTIASFVNDHQITFLFTGTDDGVSLRNFGGKVPTIYSKRLVQAYNEELTCPFIQPGLVDVGIKSPEKHKGTPSKGGDAKQPAVDAKQHQKELLEYFSGHPRVVEKAVDIQLTAREDYMGPLNQYKSLFFIDGVQAGKDGAAYYNRRVDELGLKHLKAAHIHAGTPKGERRQIYQNFKEGKITALFNDRIFTFGFDDRETAVIHDLKLHDRGSARELARMEQIFTRGTRQCEWFKEKYGIEKQAMLISYRPLDEKGNPLDVLTSADLLAELKVKPKPPGKGKGWGKGGGDRRPELSDDLEVTVHFDFGDQMAIAEVMSKAHEAAKKAEEDAKLPDKTKDDLTIKDEVPITLSIRRENPKYAAWRTQVEAKLEAGETVKVGEYPIQKMQSGVQRPYCLNRNALPALAEQVGLKITGKLPKKTKDDLTIKDEVPKAFKISPENTQYVAWRTQVEAKLEAGETVEVGGYTIQQMRSGRQGSYCLNRNALPALAEQVGLKIIGELPKKTKDDLTLKAELPRALKIDTQKPKYIAWRTQVEAKLEAGEAVEVGGYPIQQMNVISGTKPYCLNRKALPILAGQLGIKKFGELPEKTKNDLSLAREVPLALKTGSSNQRYVAWRTEVEEKLGAGETIEVGGYPIQQMINANNKTYCINSKAIPALERLVKELGIMLSEKTADDLTLATEIPQALKIAPVNSQYVTWRTHVEAMLEEGKTVEVGGYTIQQLQSGGRKPYCLNHKALPALRERLNQIHQDTFGAGVKSNPVKRGASITKQGEAEEELLPDVVAEMLEKNKPKRAKG